MVLHTLTSVSSSTFPASPTIHSFVPPYKSSPSQRVTTLSLLSRKKFSFQTERHLLHVKPFCKAIKRFEERQSRLCPWKCSNSSEVDLTSLDALTSSEEGNGDNLKTHDNLKLQEGNNNMNIVTKHIRFRNRFLDLVRLGSIVDNAAESFFKSEIRRRLFVTVMLVVASRVGYFIPLPGFDRRLVPDDYLGFVSGSVEELGDLSADLKLSLFQLGISPYILASIIMQVLCHFVPSFIKLRKEGLDGTEKIKSYIWWLSLATAFLESLVISIYSLPYSIYSASHRFQHVLITTILLTLGSMTTVWICDKISESGFGHGTSLILCVSILTGYSDTLHKMLVRLSSSGVNWAPYVMMFLGAFTFVTMWAVIVIEGVRKVKLQYYAFKLAPTIREGLSLPEVEPYIPFNINPSGMQPVLTATYVLAIPGILASLLRSSFWEKARDMLNPTIATASGFKPWIFYTINAFLIFSFNLLDIANLPKEMSDYIVKMGARIPSIKPGRATIEYLTKIQASTRFWGGVLLSLLATVSALMDHYFRHINAGFSIGFTSILIIVGSIIELRRSYQAYNVMPTLKKVLRRYGA